MRKLLFYYNWAFVSEDKMQSDTQTHTQTHTNTHIHEKESEERVHKKLDLWFKIKPMIQKPDKNKKNWQKDILQKTYWH